MSHYIMPSPNFSIKDQVQFQSRLNALLDLLKQYLPMGSHLELELVPDSSHPVLGEVEGNKIKIYVQDESRASEILVHEYLDYCITQAYRPYAELTKALFGLIDREATRRKEELVKSLSSVVIQALEK